MFDLGSAALASLAWPQRLLCTFFRRFVPVFSVFLTRDRLKWHAQGRQQQRTGLFSPTIELDGRPQPSHPFAQPRTGLFGDWCPVFAFMRPNQHHDGLGDSGDSYAKWLPALQVGNQGRPLSPANSSVSWPDHSAAYPLSWPGARPGGSAVMAMALISKSFEKHAAARSSCPRHRPCRSTTRR